MTDLAATRVTMVDTQVRPNDVTKFPIIAAMLEVPREAHVPDALRGAAYMGEHLPLGPARVMLEPRALAKLLDALDVQPDERVLVIGAGYGYTAALLARIAGSVVAVEEDKAMADEAARRLAAEDRVTVRQGALTAGAPTDGPYDAILVEWGAVTLPAAFAGQLKPGGRVGAIFMEGALGVARVGYLIDGAYSWRQAFNAAAPVLPGFAPEPAFQL